MRDVNSHNDGRSVRHMYNSCPHLTVQNARPKRSFWVLNSVRVSSSKTRAVEGSVQLKSGRPQPHVLPGDVRQALGEACACGRVPGRLVAPEEAVVMNFDERGISAAIDFPFPSVFILMMPCGHVPHH